MNNAARKAAATALACLPFLPLVSALAGPSDYVIPAVVEEGEKEIDFKAGTAKNHDGTREAEYSIGLGWGVTSRWFTELYAKWHKPPGERSGFDAWEWENRLQLTETGKYPVDVGFVLEIERPKDRSEGYEYRWGPLLQADVANNMQANLNVLVEKHIGAAEPAQAELGYQWQVKYLWRPALDVGVQGFGEIGPWDHWDPHSEQRHIAGPAVFGKVKVGQSQVIKYNAGVLFGLTNGSPRNTLRLQAEYEF